MENPGSDILPIGETTFRRGGRRFGLLAEDRLRHVYALGKTGVGKSTFLANAIIHDLAKGHGLAVFDPHGGLIDAVLPHVPKHRAHETVLFAPEDREHPIAWNVFRRGRERHADHGRLASELVSVFKKHWADSWGPRLEHVLRMGLLAVAESPDATLLLLYRFLTDVQARERVLAQVQDPIVRMYWTREFPKYPAALQAEALSPVLNKLGAVVSLPVVRNIVGTVGSRLDLAELMAKRGILLARLPVGAIGEDASHLLGSLLLSGLQLTAMSRPPGSPPFYIYLDEFQRWTNDSVAVVLAESRKFAVSITAAHQYLAQLPESVLDAVLGNIGTALVFRIGADDAIRLAPEFAPEFEATDLERLERYHLAVKMMARGESLSPFSARTLPPIPPPADAAERVKRLRQLSRERFSNRREDVERAIAKAFARD